MSGAHRTPPDVPEDVRRFLLNAIPSVPHLEAVLLLRSDEVNEWSVERLGDGLFLAPARAAVLLADLHRLGLAQPAPSGAWRYAPRNDEMRQAVDRVADYYRLNVIKVSRLLHVKLEQRAHDFSEVFRLRKDK